MRRIRQDLPSALVSFLTVSVALWSWGGFLTDPGAYRGLMATVGVMVLVLGIAVRALLPRWSAPVIQVPAALGLVLLHLTGGSAGRLHAYLDAARATFVHGYPPVPAQDIAIVLLPGAALAYAGADALGITARRPALTGLVLLIVLAVPMGAAGTKGNGVPWAVFVLAALGFLVLLGLEERSRVRRWGRPLDVGEGRALLSQRTPALVGVTATALALVVPLGLPTLHLRLNGWGAGNGDPITVTNPMVGMYGDLRQNADVDLVDVTTGPGAAADAPPSYLKVAVLSQFNGAEWSTGNRRIPSSQTADGVVRLPRQRASIQLDPSGLTSYRFSATSKFVSSWLPVFNFPVDVRADGDWRYDTSTYDFLAADKSLNTAGEGWTETAAAQDPAESTLARAPFGQAGAPAIDTTLPGDFPARIGAIAERVAGDQPTPFQEAVALQRWFTTTGGFRYSLQRPGGDSSADLLSFLTSEKVGYCQQFATAMAAMARTLGIPARVDVGFLHAHAIGQDEYVFRGQDMHAWPELWFPTVGWVRFEPTPGVGAVAPSYTDGVPLATPQSTNTQTPPDETILPTQHPQPSVAPPSQRHHRQAAAARARQSAHSSPAWLWAVLGVMVAALAAALPWWVRRRRRAARLAGGAEAQWAEVADTARDLGLPWADEESPRGQGRRLAPHVSRESRESLDRIVLAVERSRYARPGAAYDDVRADAETVIGDLVGGVSRGAARSAALLPPTVLLGAGRVRRRLATTGAAGAPSDELH